MAKTLTLVLGLVCLTGATSVWAQRLPVGVDATMRDSLSNDQDSDNRADPGDTLRYTIIISNTGTLDATGVILMVTPSAGSVPMAGSVQGTPLVFSQVLSTTEDNPVVILLAGFDLNGDPLTFSTLVAPASGSLGPITMVDATSSMVTYTPNLNINGTDMFSFQASDNAKKGPAPQPNSNVATITITVTAVEDPPDAVDDLAGTVEDSPFDIDVLVNDSDPDPGDMISVSGATNGASGTTSVNMDDTIRYIPSGDTSGVDAFTYTIQDIGGLMDSATVEVSITAVNDSPVALGDAASVVEGGTADMVVGSASVLGNDSDVDGTALIVSATPVSGPFHGILILNGNGTFLYTHDGSEGATDEFTYEVCDDGLPLPATCTTAVVVISVTSVNDLPLAVTDTYLTNEDEILSVTTPGLLGNDIDDDIGAILEVTAVDTMSASGATITSGTEGSFVYDPTAVAAFQALASGEVSLDTFSYTISDGTAMSSASVEVTVVGQNDDPIARDDDFAITQQQVLMGDVLVDNGSGADSDIDASDTLSVSQVNGSGANVGAAFALPSGATLTHNAAGSFTYDPNTQFVSLGVHESATDSYTYELSDGNGGVDSATVVIDVSGTNDPPVAQNDDLATDEDTPISGNVFADNGNGPDNDPDASDVIAVSAVNGMGGLVGTTFALPSGASVTVTMTGVLNYDPNGAFNFLTSLQSATDTFTYTITDGTVTDSATVEITVTGVNDPPMAMADSYNALGNTQLVVDSTGEINSPTDEPAIESLQGNLLANDTDPDTGDTLVVDAEVKSSSEGGTVDIRSDGSFSYIPPSGFSNNPNPDSFTYTVRDDSGTPAVATAEISVARVIWFIDDTAAGGGDGTSAMPFNSLAAFDAGATDATGDIIFIYEGNSVATPLDAGPSAAGLELLNQQQVLGEAFGLTVTHPDSATTQVTLVPTGGDPHLTNSVAGGAVITLASNSNEVHGLTVTGAAGGGIHGSGVSNTIIADVTFENLADTAIAVNSFNTTIDNVSIDNVGGSGIIVANATGVTTIDDVTMTQVAGVGIVLATPSGTVDVRNPVIQGPILGAISVVAGDAVISVTDADIDVTVGSSCITVGNFAAPGQLAFGGLANSLRSQGGIGISLSGFDGDVTIPGFEMVGTGGQGIVVANNNTGTATIRNASLSGTFAQLVNVNGTSAASNAPTLDLAGMTASNSAGGGVRTANFSGTTDLSNGSIDVAGGRLFDFDTATNGGPDLTGTVLDNTDGNGIRAANCEGTFTFPAVAITNAQNNALDLNANNGGGGATFNFTSLGTVTSQNGDGLFALNGGTVNFVATDTVFDATGGSAVDIQATTGLTNGNPGWTLAGLSSRGTGDSGVRLNSVVNSFTVTGPTTIDGSNTGNGIEVLSCPNGVSFADVEVGSMADPLAGIGANLQNSGTIGFESLDIFNSTNTGFSASAVNTLRVDGGNISTTGTGSPLNVSGSAIEAVTGVNFTSIRNTTLNGNRLANLQTNTGGTVNIGSATGTSVGGAATGIEVAGSSAAAIFGNVALANFGGAGVTLSNNTGSVAINGGSVSGSGAQGFLLDQGNAGVTMNASVSGSVGNAVQVTNRTGGAASVGGAVTGSFGGILVQNNTAGSLTFTGMCDLDTGTNTAVNLNANNVAFTTSFNGSLDVTTTTGFGFHALSGGTANVSLGMVKSVTSTNGTAVSISTLTAGLPGINFGTITSSDGTNGVTISNLSGGPFDVLGLTSIHNSAGASISISNLSDVNTAVDFGQVSITNRNNTGILVDNADNTTGDISFGDVTVGVPSTQVGDGVTIQNSDADVDFSSLDIQN